jgi:hypothetical protein
MFRTVLSCKGVGCEDVDWIKLAFDTDHRLAVVNTSMNLCIP